MPPKKKPAAKRKASAAGGAPKKAKGGGAAAGAIPVDEHAPAGSTVHGDYSWCAQPLVSIQPATYVFS